MSTIPSARPLSPTGLLTAVPGLLGFIPDRSIVVLAFGDDPRIVRTAMRHDLVVDDDGEMVPALAELFSSLAEVCVRNEVRAAVLVIVDDRFPAADLRYRRVCGIADRRFSEIGGIATGFVIPEFAEGGRWLTIWEAGRVPLVPGAIIPIARDAPTRGRLGDPQSSPTALQRAVRTGHGVLARRSDMEAMLAPLDHCAGPHLDEVDHGASAGMDQMDTADEMDDASLLRAVVHQVIVASGPRRPDEAAGLGCAEVTRLGAALTRLPVRDAALSFAVTDLRGAAESLWRELARRLRGPAQASAATMLAHLHYINGEGGHAGVALDHALRADPHWSLATLLDSALRGGLAPHLLHDMIDDCYDIAERLGVPLPAPSLERDAG